MLNLVSYFSDEGEIVLDPFAGSGTTLLAAKLLGRRWIGAEIDQVWWDRAIARVALAPGQMTPSDLERLNRWRESQASRQADMARMKNHTAKIRAGY
jgi:DNA modification methylase